MFFVNRRDHPHGAGGGPMSETFIRSKIEALLQELP
jgi:hypothetical protein